MFNIIIFLIGAGIMFYMAWRSWSRRRKLMTKGEKVEAAVAGTVQSRDGKAYLLEFTTAGGTHRLHYPKSAKGRELAQGAVVTLYYNPDDPAGCTSRATSPSWVQRCCMWCWASCCWY